MFFGSALTNFGLEPFLQALVELAPPPQPRPSDSGIVSPTDERFTGFVFKIQANMDPRHRDRVAFVRVCSGRFAKDMTVFNSRVGKPLRASRAYRFFGRDRETISVAYAGDIIGLVNPGQFTIGDTLHTGAPLRFLDVPRFPAEHFGRVRLQDTRYKQFDEGLRQLEEEGLMQVFYVTARPPRADRRRRRRAAVRRDHQPSAHRVRRGGRSRAADVHRRPMGRGSDAADAVAGRTDHGGRGSAGSPRAAVHVGVGASVFRAPASRRFSCSPSRRSPLRQRAGVREGTESTSRAAGLRLSRSVPLRQQMGQVLWKKSQICGTEEQVRASRRNGPRLIHSRLLGADNDPSRGAGFVPTNGADECSAVEGAHSKLRIGDNHGRRMFVDIHKGLFGVADPVNRKALGTQRRRPHFGRVVTVHDQHGSHMSQRKRFCLLERHTLPRLSRFSRTRASLHSLPCVDMHRRALRRSQPAQREVSDWRATFFGAKSLSSLRVIPC